MMMMMRRWDGMVNVGVMMSCIFIIIINAALGDLGSSGDSSSMSDDCLYKICLKQASSSTSTSPHGVFRQDAQVLRKLVQLKPARTTGGNSNDNDDDDDVDSCSSNSITKYSRLIKCSCSPPISTNGLCRVTQIDFSQTKLNGSLPSSIGDLTYLKSLDLSNNLLSGTIPKSLTSLKQLEYLHLDSNNLEGPIPAFNRHNSKLQSLDLSRNQLNGSIPKGLGQLSSLNELILGFNKLSGPIPDEIWNLTSLEFFTIIDNYHVYGGIPEEIGYLENLEILGLMNNNLGGELPKSIANLTNLQDLSIQGNNFNGTIPDGISHLPNLEYLWLVGNKFEGPLPKAFSSKTLSEILISDVSKDAYGTSNSFPDVGGLINLETLTLRNCSLTGPIPDEIWMLPNLTSLDLSFNMLSGNVPLSLDHQFVTVFLGSNRLDGSLPEWAYNRTNAIYADVSHNLFNPINFNGEAKFISNKNLFSCCTTSSRDGKNKWLSNNYRCETDTGKYDVDELYINCGGNETKDEQGKLYQEDKNPEGLSTFVMSKHSTWGYSSFGYFLAAETNYYTLTQTCNMTLADAPLYTGARVAPVSLKYYGFCLKTGNYNVVLDFAEIGWDAFNEYDYGHHRVRRVFNVAIQGETVLRDFNIAEQARGLDKNISRNFTAVVNDSRLEIHFYWSGRGSICVPLYHGPLISAISISPVPKPRHHKPSLVLIGSIVGSSFIFVAVIIALLRRLGWLGAKKPKRDGVELYPGGIFNFQEIKAATHNFDSNKKIGETGTVYQGKLADGIEVAVKQLSVKSKQEINQIIKEIGIIYTLQHPNIAKPMGCCFKEKQLLLVYKFMENRSLQHALFGSDDDVRSKLNWRTRFKIILGMAKGLMFLHEESNMEIIQGNIKPTNILLDRDFNVKISDFRYSQLHDHAQHNTEVTNVYNPPRAKDTGHMPPEYMLGMPLTPKADVYSFGLVMLEIISGLPLIMPKPKKEDVHLLNLAYKYYEEGNLEALVDSSLHEHRDYKHHEAVTILYLAMQCVSPSFDVRPAMSQVVQILQGKKKFKDKRINPSPVIENHDFRYESISQE